MNRLEMHVSTDDDGASPPWVICTLWIYEHRSQADVLFNPDHLPHGVLRDGGLARLAALPQNSKVRDFHDGPESHGVHSTAHMSEKSRDAGSVSDFGPSNSAQWPLKNGLSLKRYERRSCLFVAKEASTEVKTKMPALQVRLAL